MICGYSDRWSVRPGDTVQVMVSTEASSTYAARLVRLEHSDQDPGGPTHPEIGVDAVGNGHYPGRHQRAWSGSHVIVPAHPALGPGTGLSLGALIWPTKPGQGIQAILGRWDPAGGPGFALVVNESAATELWLRGPGGATQRFQAGAPLRERCWYRVAAIVDPAVGTVQITQVALPLRPVDVYARVTPIEDGSQGWPLSPPTGEAETISIPLMMAALPTADGALPGAARHHFNGKLESPWLADRALGARAIDRVLRGDRVDGLVGRWNFAANIDSGGVATDVVVDSSGRDQHGRTVNQPTRAVTGHNWTGKAVRFIDRPDEYAAIHFHDDDLDDARWLPDFSMTVPPDATSGIYAIHLAQGLDDHYVPLFVKPSAAQATRPLAFLAPTATYAVYANVRGAIDVPLTELYFGRTLVFETQELFLAAHREFGLSPYDTHSDGSGVAFASRRRPVLNLQPRRDSWDRFNLGTFIGDLRISSWMTRQGFEHDVITDDDLHTEGVDLLRPYRAVVTGCHPEYYSGAMLDAVEQYVCEGGRVVYLGGNGFHGSIAFHPHRPDLVEIRRWGGGNDWEALPGEFHYAFTGEVGGSWRLSGRDPHKLMGLGYIASGFDSCSFYRRQPGSKDSRASWIFEGVADDERIGDFGAVGGGAAGLEIDSMDSRRGSPPGTLLLASSEGHSNNYVGGDGLPSPGTGAAENPAIRADVTYYATATGGGVFAVGSIAWGGSLTHHGDRNNVSTITANVLRRFSDPEPLPQ